MKATPTLRFLFPVLLTGFGVFILISANPKSLRAGTGHPQLACGSDHFTFQGLPQEVAVVETKGPATVGGTLIIYDIAFPLNGLTPAFGVVISGQPEAVGTTLGNTLLALGVDQPPQILQTILAGSNSFSPDCCNEQMVFAPDGHFYHAHYSDVIQQLSVQSGQSVVLATFQQSGVVGMASDGTKIWISNWSGRQVGTWDPSTNIFTPIFSTPNNAGALAWDVANGVLWVGMTGGSVIPYDASGNQLGPGFQPFGSMNDTIDGLAFVPGH